MNRIKNAIRNARTIAQGEAGSSTVWGGGGLLTILLVVLLVILIF